MSELNFYLLQINDALFPIGAYSHSQGLETYIQQWNCATMRRRRQEYIHNKTPMRILPYTELLAARLSYLAAAYGDLEQTSFELEEILEASRIPMEQREAAQESGFPFCKDDRKIAWRNDAR